MQHTKAAPAQQRRLSAAPCEGCATGNQPSREGLNEGESPGPRDSCVLSAAAAGAPTRLCARSASARLP